MTEYQGGGLNERYLSIQGIKAIIWQLNKYHTNVKHISDDEQVLMFAILDRSAGNKISLEEFLAFVDVLQLRFERADIPSFMEVHFPGTAKSRWFSTMKTVVASVWFDRFIDFLLLVNLAVVVYTFRGTVTGAKEFINDFEGDKWIRDVQTVLTCAYLVEILLKIWVMGFRKYMYFAQNVFDAVATFAGVVSVILLFQPFIYENERLLRYFILTPTIRILRLVTTTVIFKEIGDTFVELVPAAKGLFINLFCTMYLFATIGTQLYGGKINTDPESKYSAMLVGSMYGDSNYYANNFNDLGSGMVTLYELLVVNNWFVIVDGFIEVSNKWFRWFFIGYYCVMVLIVLNLLIAFILDVYGQYEQQKREGIKSSVTISDASNISGRATNLTGSYKVSMEKEIYYQTGSEIFEQQKLA